MNTSLTAVTLQSNQAWQVVSEPNTLSFQLVGFPGNGPGKGVGYQGGPSVGDMGKGPPEHIWRGLHQPRDAPDLFFFKARPNKEGKVGLSVCQKGCQLLFFLVFEME